MAGRKKNVDDRIKKQPSNNQWFQNAAKSLGFSTAEIVKDLMPNTADFIDWNKTDTMDLLKSLRTNHSSRSMVNKQFKNIPQIKAASDILKNAKEDLLSGNFNNKEREFDFDDLDFGFGDITDEDKDMFINEDQNNPIIIDTMPLAKIINSGNEATIDTMINVAEQQMAIESEKIMFNHKSTSAILGGLNAINDNLATLVRFNAESTAKYHAASLKFYEDMIDFMKESNKNVKTPEGMEDVDFGKDLYTSRGGVKIKEYANIVKKNIADMKEKNPSGSTMMSLVSDPLFYKQLAKNPIGTLTRVMATELMPAATKTAMKAIDDSISSVLPAIMAKINTLDGDENPLYDFLFKVLGSKAKLDYKVDLGKYEKGAISWDGESKKALVEVIPAYLRRIESALTGQEERVYNYDDGKFTNMSTLKKDYKKKVRERETYGYLDVKNKAMNLAHRMGANQDVMDQFEEDMNELLAAMTRKGSVIKPNLYKNKQGEIVDDLFNEGLFDFDPQRREFVRKVFGGLSQDDLIRIASQGIDESRRETQRFYDEIRKNPNLSGHNLIYNEDDVKAKYIPTSGGIMGQKDKFGLSQLDYLRDIRSALINGIRVFPDVQKRYKNWQPNLEIVRREYQENKDYNRKLSREKAETNATESKDYNYNDLLNMSDEEIREIYNTQNNISDTQYNGPLGNVLNKVNNTAKGISSKITNKMYNMLYGDEIDIDMTRINQMAGAGNTGRGLFGNVIGFFQDSLKSTVAYFTGEGYEMSDGTRVEPNPNSFMNKMKSFFTGSIDKLTNGEEGGLLGKISRDFMDGFNQFKVNLFGEKNLEGRGQETLKELTDKVKSRLPKAIGMGLGGAMVKTFAASQLGILGSVLLPGGPIGAALVGTTFGFLKQSETFNKWMFGDIDEDGKRMGGVISKEWQEKFGENKGLIGKAAGVGVLSSLIMGPVAGSLLGIGTAMASKNEAFQEFLYGKDYKEKEKKSLMDGAFGKVYKNMMGKDSNPQLATFLGAGGIGVGLAQGVGLLPSFLLPGGPIMGSMLGLAAGITASSDSFQNFLFGEKDVDGKRYGGLMTKFTNWIDTSLLQPLKIKGQEISDKLYGFLRKNVLDPITSSFEPIMQAGKFMIEDIKDSIKESFLNVTEPVISSFREHVTKPLGDALKKALINPLKSLVKGMFSMVGKLAGSIITSPIKAIGLVGKMAEGFNEERLINKEEKRRRDEYFSNISEDEMSTADLVKGIKAGKMSKEERKEFLDKNLTYRDGKTRKEREKERKDALKEEMAKRAAKRAEMQKQFEEDRAFGKASGWKYASKSQKERREQELKEKEAWLQERMANQSEETGEKVSKMTGVVEKVSEFTESTVDVLKDIQGLLKDNLKSLGKRTGMTDVIQDLRDNGQSHEDGLDEVPRDGYVAELHQGEMVVPKKPAGILRNIFGGGASLISKMISDESKDRNDNALGLTDEEAEQQKELKDRDNYSKVSRKNIDFMQNKIKAEKKEKEEKQWRDDIISAVHGVGAKVAAGTAANSSLFDKLKDLFGKIPNLLGGLGGVLGNIPSNIASTIGSVLSSLGIGGSLATIAGVLMGKWYDYQQGEEYQLSRTDKDGYQITDDANLEIGKKLLTTGTRKAFMKPIKTLKTKVVDPVIEGGKSIVKGVKNTGGKIKQGVTKAATKFDDYINPKKIGKTALGETYSYSMGKSARKGFAKPVGAVADAVKGGAKKVSTVAKAGKEKASTIISKFIGVAKTALGFLRDKLVEKFPKIGKFASKCDNIFAKMLKNADNIVAKFGKKVSGFLTSSTLKSNPVGVALDAVLAVGDFISGLTAGNAGNLFGVAKQNVDGKMRGICAVLQTVCNFSWMGVIWIINEICNSMFGVNFIRTLAIWIYNAIPGDKIDTNDTDISNCDSIESALATLQVPDSHIHFFKDNDKWKDFSKAKIEEFHGVISAAELMELARLQYNLENGTFLDKDAWLDKESQTLGGKVLDAIKKPFKKTNKEKQEKYQKKVDKYSSKVAKYEEKVENSGNFITKGWNKMLLNYNKKKLKKNEKKLQTITNVIAKEGTNKPGQQKAQISDYTDKNAATEQDKLMAQTNYEMQAAAMLEGNGIKVLDDEGNWLADDAGMGDGEEEDKYGVKQAKKIEKQANTQENKTMAKMLTKSGQTVLKNMKNYTSVIGKGLSFNIGLVSKTFKAAQSGLSKIAKKTSKDIEKDTDSTTKDLVNENKTLVSAVKNSFSKVKEKVQGITGSLSNIQLGGISLGSIGDSISNGITGIFKSLFGGDDNETSTDNSSSGNKSLLSKIGDGLKSVFNWGKSGTDTVTRTSRDSGYIQPTNTTNNNNTSNTNNKFVFYSQSDSRWGNNRIGGTRKNMTEAGCGPTSLAMAISQMTGEEITPDVIARLGKDYLPGYSEYKLFPEMAKKFGMNYFDTADANEIMDSLRNGKPVILSGKSDGKGMTPYTKEGHIVVANQIDGNRVFVNDPRGKEFSRYYTIDELMSGLNRGMVLSPSNQMNINKYSKGKLEGWVNPTGENPSQIPLLFGDSEFTNMQENLGGTAGKVRVADRVLSYARAFLANTSKFKYSQAQNNTTGRYGIDNNNIGADCSSFVSHLLSVAGDTGKIAYLSQSFWDQAGYKVDDPQIGDVVCQQNHVGLYSGDGNYIHMSGRKDGIKESKAIQRGNNKHRGYKRVLKDPNALVDATITGGNSLLGTVVATESGNPVTSGGGTTPTTGDTTGGSQASSGVEQMGVFAKMGNYANNLMASIFNGKEVDMYATNTVDTSSSTSPSNGTVDISNSGSTKKAVWDFFTGMGYSKEATAGIMGNFQQESGIDPTKIQGNGKGPAAGIAQWENYNKKSARWADMNKYAQSKGKDWTDLQSQLEFVHKELEGSAPDTYTASLLKKRGGIEKLKSLTNVRDAVKMFEETFERASKPMWENRYKYADNIYNEFANSNNAGGAGGYATATSAETAPYDGSIPSSMNGWKYYKQGDPQWQKGANGRVGKQGCGMASHAMMLTTMFGKEITPVTVGEWAIKNGHWPSGMSWTMPAAIGKKFDLSMPFNVQKSNGASKADLESVKAEIKAGRPVILSGRGKSKDLNTPFTTGGHIVLAVGVDGQNRLIINDPRGPQYTKAYEDSGVMDIGVGLRGAWSFEKTGSSSIPSDWSTGSDFAAGNNGNTGNTDLSITGDGSTAAAPSIDQMGVFAKMGNFANNLMASIYNGKAVDMYAANTVDTSTTPTDGSTPTPGDATWNGTQYDVSKYDMSGLSDKKLGHINKILQPALHTYKTHNLLPSVTIAQSVGESGWGPSSGLATKGNNLFGIKCGSKWTGKAYTAKTGEFLNGKNVTITDSFRAYDSMADSVIDRANFLSASRYKAMMTKNTAREQFQAMKNGGYATDPNYVNKMMQIVNDSKLTRFDSPKPPVEVSGGDAGKGDDETVWANGFGPSTKPPVKVRRTTNSSMNGPNVNINTDSQRKVDSLGREINATVNYNMSATAPGASNTDYRTILRAIMEQLQFINSNTAETARSVNNIEIVSANEPISGGTPGSKSPKKSIDNRQANSNTGYDIARKMAAYK